MTISQLLLTVSTLKKISLLSALEDIHEDGVLSYSDGTQRADNPYRYGTLEETAWSAGWDYANANDDFAQEAMRS